MLIPVTHRVVVKQLQLEATRQEYKRANAMGLIIPETEDKMRAQAGVDQGTIIAFGPTAFRDFETEIPFKVGDFIAFAKYSGKVITDPEDNQEYVVINDDDVICVIKENKETE